MTDLALILLSVAALLFLVRIAIGPGVADRVIATDGLLVTVMCGVLVGASHQDSSIGMDTVLVVALLGFVATGVLARYLEQRGSR